MKRDLLLAELERAHNLVWLPVEEVNQGTTAGTLDALVAKIDILPQRLLDPFRQMGGGGHAIWRCLSLTLCPTHHVPSCAWEAELSGRPAPPGR